MSKIKEGQWIYILDSGGGYTTHGKLKYEGTYGKSVPKNCVYRVKNVLPNKDYPLIQELEDLTGANYFYDLSGTEVGKYWKVATSEEIKEHLVKIAKSKGFKEGAKFKNLFSDSIQEVRWKNISYNQQRDSICFNPGFIYEKGVWAEVIKEEKEMYTVDYCKKNKIAILTKNIEEYKEIIRICNPSKSEKFYGDNWYTIIYEITGSYFDLRQQSNSWLDLSEYKVIAFEEFKQSNLSMNKKITGYKCIKAYPGVKLGEVYPADSHTAKLYPEFWEAQYEPEFKVGDWVTTTTSRPGYEKGNAGETFQITEIDKKKNHVYFAPVRAVDIDRVRLATPEEIQAASQVKLGKYTVIFNNGYKFTVGCTTYTKKDAENAKKVLELRNIDHIVFSGGVQVNLETINKIISRLVKSGEDEDLPF